ncbi:MAG: DUF58 domain-containing protein [Sphaerochaetaceae bacterium]|nr:DUF58 domain-containing protein [Sphaerochaetaceae bacterium]
MGKRRISLYRSSLLVSLVSIIVTGVSFVLLAFLGFKELSLGIMLVFFVSLISRLWAIYSSKNLKLEMTCSSSGLFPGEKLNVDILVENNKLLPLLWLDLFIPLSRRLALVPETTRVPETWEAVELSYSDSCEDEVGSLKLVKMLWYDRLEETIPFEGKKRGIYCLDHWVLRTGDPFGLCQKDVPFPKGGIVAVYPSLIPIDEERFIRNLWESNTGKEGVLDDKTLLRGIRKYENGDSYKAINWRLLARALPLSVNLYERVVPMSLHFIFDGESFNGPNPHFEEMEKTLSIIASYLVSMERKKVSLYITVCKGRNTLEQTLSSANGLEAMLRLLASYENEEAQFDVEKREYVYPTSYFNVSDIMTTAPFTGKFIYFSYSDEGFNNNSVLRALNDFKVISVVTKKNNINSSFTVIENTSLLRRVEQ